MSEDSPNFSTTPGWRTKHEKMNSHIPWRILTKGTEMAQGLRAYVRHAGGPEFGPWHGFIAKHCGPQVLNDLALAR